MYKIIGITKLLMTENSTFEFYSEKLKRKSIIKILIAFIFWFLFISLFCYAISKAYDILFSTEQRETLFGIGLFISNIFVLINGLFFSMSVLFYSKDNEYLLPLPIHISTIITSKFLVILLNGYLAQSIIILPFILVFGVKGATSMFFWISSILIFLVLPVLPLVIESIIVFCIMRFLPNTKNKDLFKLLGGLAILIIGIALQVLIMRIINSNTNILEGFLNDSYNIVKIIDPIAAIASKVLFFVDKFNALWNLLLLIGVSLVAIVSFVFIGIYSYGKSYHSLSESNSSKMDEEVNIKLYRYRGNHHLALLEREYKTLFRTPDYFLNCIIPNLLYPLLLVLLYFSNIIGELIFYLKLNIYTEYFVLFGFCFMLFQSSLNITSATSISRDGKDFFNLKFMPIKPKVYLRTKLATSLIIGFINLIINVGLLIFLGIPTQAVILFAITSIMAVVFTNELGILFDLHFPKMNWNNEWQVTRKNITPIFCNIVCTLLSGLTGYIMFYLHLSAQLYCLLLAIIFGLINILLYNVICSHQNKISEIIE